ncbi:UNVERIFIED_CONTAM: hypothetical protein HHA_231360 [Hammondia hammondi]|eukprot:XP_008885706.1 hypothetical protein HHA_231360 [Hammondia hammondi]
MTTAGGKGGISLALLLSRRISCYLVSPRSSVSSSLLLFHLVFLFFSSTVSDKPVACLSLALRPSPPHPPLCSFFPSSFTSPCPSSPSSPSPSSPSSPSSSSSLSFSVSFPGVRRPPIASSRPWVTLPRLSIRTRQHGSLFLRSRRSAEKERRSERRRRSDSRTPLLFLSSVGAAEHPSVCGRHVRGPANLDRWKAKQYRHSHLFASPWSSSQFSSSSSPFLASPLFSPPLSLDALSFASSPVLFRHRLPSTSSPSSPSSFSSLSSFSSFLSPVSSRAASPSYSSSFSSLPFSSSSLGLQHRSGVTPHVRPTEETVETVEISDGFLTEEEEQNAHYPFVDAPLNLLLDPTPLRKEIEARQRRRQRLSLLQSLAASPLSPQALHAPHVSRQSNPTNKATDAGEETETPGDSETEHEAVDPVPPDVRTDFIELDRFYPGLGPWPSTADLQRLNATYDRLPGTLHEDTNSELHYRSEVKTIAEAQLEFERWRPRMGLDRLYWVLEADEEAQLPPRFLKRYQAVRRQLLPAPRQQFANWLGENYVSPDEPLPEVGIPEEEEDQALAPGMLRFMESSYTYTPPLSPVDGEVDMYDDPPDAPWRRRVESKIRRAVEWGFPERVRPYRTGFTTYDISWYAGTLDVVVMILPGPSPPAAKLLSLQDLKRFRQLIGDMLDELEDKEQLYVTRNHQIVVSSLPVGEERRLLCCRKDFNLFAGSECTFMFDRHASAVLNPLSEETAALLLEECAQTVATARRSLLPHEKALLSEDFALEKSEAAAKVKTLRELHAAVASSARHGVPQARDGAQGDREATGGCGVGDTGRDMGEAGDDSVASFLGRKGEILQGHLLGSPNPVVMAIAIDGRVCYVSHDHVKKVYRTAPVVSPWVSRARFPTAAADCSLRSSFESSKAARDKVAALFQPRELDEATPDAGLRASDEDEEDETEDVEDSPDLFKAGRVEHLQRDDDDGFFAGEVEQGEDEDETPLYERRADSVQDTFEETDFDAYEGSEGDMDA